MAATVYKARVWEVAAVTGTGTVALIGSAQPGYRAFSSCVPSGSLVAYCIYDATAQAWETGIGIFTITATPAGTLTRGLSESSTGSLIDFIGNSCNITLDMISPVQVSAGAASAGLIPALNAEGLIDASMGGGGSGTDTVLSVASIPGAIEYTQAAATVGQIYQANQTITIYEVEAYTTTVSGMEYCVGVGIAADGVADAFTCSQVNLSSPQAVSAATVGQLQMLAGILNEPITVPAGEYFVVFLTRTDGTTTSAVEEYYQTSQEYAAQGPWVAWNDTLAESVLPDTTTSFAALGTNKHSMMQAIRWAW